MDESTLKSLLENLEKCRSSLDSQLTVFTWLVVIGVSLEVIFIIWEYRDELHDWGRGFVHPPYRPNRIKLLLELLGTGLVVTGVAGELWAEAKIGAVETKIRKANGDLVLSLEQKAGALREYVGQLEKQSGWRSVDGKIFLAELEGKPKARVRIWFTPNNPEAYALALQIAGFIGPGAASSSAGWNVLELRPIPPDFKTDEHGSFTITSTIETNGPSSRTYQNLGKYIPGVSPQSVEFLGSGASGLTLLSITPEDEGAVALTSALAKSSNLTVVNQSYSGMPTGEIILVITQRR